MPTETNFIWKSIIIFPSLSYLPISKRQTRLLTCPQKLEFFHHLEFSTPKGRFWTALRRVQSTAYAFLPVCLWNSPLPASQTHSPMSLVLSRDSFKCSQKFCVDLPGGGALIFTAMPTHTLHQFSVFLLTKLLLLFPLLSFTLSLTVVPRDNMHVLYIISFSLSPFAPDSFIYLYSSRNYHMQHVTCFNLKPILSPF